MRILGVDTSSGIASVAVSRDMKILGYRREARRSMQAENLFILMQDALSEAELSLQDIDCLAVTVGPGSFTGVRIGLAAARGISIAQPSLMTLGVTNFDLCFFRLQRQVEHVQHHVVAINAFRGQCYVQVMSDNQLHPPLLLDKDQFITLIRNLEGAVAIGGSYLVECYHELTQDAANLLLLPRFAVPDAKNLCRVVASREKESAHNVELIPLYIRKPDAKLPS